MDPIAFDESESMYAYGGNNSLSVVDPYGLWGWHWPPWKPKPKPTPEEQAMDALARMLATGVAKCITKCAYGPDAAQNFGFGVDMHNKFRNLPEKYRSALNTCMESAREICDPDSSSTDRWVACYACCEAIHGASGSKRGAYHTCMRACSEFERGRPR